MIDSVPAYFQSVEKLLWDMSTYAEVDMFGGAQWGPNYDRWVIATFRARVRFRTGHSLAISDNFSRKHHLRQDWSRKFSYLFTNQDSERMFLFDTHGLFGLECHMQPDDDTRLTEGDPKLKGFSPRDVDFTDICTLVQRHFEDIPFPWEQRQ